MTIIGLFPSGNVGRIVRIPILDPRGETHGYKSFSVRPTDVLLQSSRVRI